VVAWPLLILVALLGWGLAAARTVARLSGVTLRSLGERLALGLALLLAIAGMAVALGAFSELFVTMCVGAGSGWTLLELWRHGRRMRFRLSRRQLLHFGIGSALIAVVLMVALWNTAHFAWDACDDDTGYLYLAKRLVVHGDLLDPMNLRRLTTLGGMSALQAMFLMHLPDTMLPLADFFIGSLLIVLLVGRAHAGRWAPWAIGAAFLVMLFPAALGTHNSSPLFIPVGFSLAAFSLAHQLRVETATSRERLTLAVILGLLIATAVTLRPQFGIPLVLVAAAVIAWPPLSAATMQRTAGLGIGMLLVLSGWCIASLRAVATPLFPLMSGNLNPAWPVNGPPGSDISIGSFLSRLGGALVDPPWAAALLGTIVVIALAVAPGDSRRSFRGWAIRVQILAVISSTALLALLLALMWNADPPQVFARYWAPVMMAALLLPFVLVQRVAREPRRTMLDNAVVCALVALTTAASPVLIGKQVVAMVHDTFSGSVGAELAADRYAAVRAEYGRAGALLSGDARVLAAVDVPSLLMSSSRVVDSLDIPGSTSPAPHLPFFRGTAVKLAWLRDHGFDYVVAAEPAGSACLYNGQRIASDSAGNAGPVHQAWTPYYYDWFGFVSDVIAERPAGATRVGELVVLKL